MGTDYGFGLWDHVGWTVKTEIIHSSHTILIQIFEKLICLPN